MIIILAFVASVCAKEPAANGIGDWMQSVVASSLVDKLVSKLFDQEFKAFFLHQPSRDWLNAYSDLPGRDNTTLGTLGHIERLAHTSRRVFLQHRRYGHDTAGVSLRPSGMQFCQEASSALHRFAVGYRPSHASASAAASCMRSSCRRKPFCLRCVSRQTATAAVQLTRATSSDSAAPSTEMRKREFSLEEAKKYGEELGKLFELTKNLVTEGPKWDKETRDDKVREFAKVYVEVFAPAVAYSATILCLDVAFIAFYLLMLSLSGVGYKSLQDISAGVPIVGDTLRSIDASWGNLAIAILLIDITSPIILPIGLKITPKATELLERKLADSGLDADGIIKQLEVRGFLSKPNSSQ